MNTTNIYACDYYTQENNIMYGMRSLQHLRSSMKHQDISHLYMSFQWAAYQCASPPNYRRMESMFLEQKFMCTSKFSYLSPLIDCLMLTASSMGMMYQG
jgi:hypothetical protein